MEIRKACSTDAEDIAVHNIALARESENKTISPDTARRGVQAILDDPAKGFYLVAVDEQCIIGELMVTYEWSDWRARSIWWLQSVYVTPSQRQQGIFTRLLKRLREMAHEQDICELRLYVHHDNEAACQTYHRLGFTRLPYHMYGIDV
ncbi:MAG: GNAT family N-acetyltransferase [Thermoplasmatota archaeon]